MTNEQAVVMNVPKEVLDQHIKLAVAQVLSRDPERFITACVDVVLQAKDQNNYNRKTVLDTVLEKLIIETAQKSAQEWINEQGPKIREAVRKRLDKDKGALIQKLVDGLGDQLQKNVHVSVSISER